MADKHQRDPQLNAAQTASGSAPDAKAGKAHRNVARILAGIAATLLIVFCSWSLAVYLQ